MARLEKIWVERHSEEPNAAIRIDWDNDRHQRIEIKGSAPMDVIEALRRTALELENEWVSGHI